MTGKLRNDAPKTVSGHYIQGGSGLIFILSRQPLQSRCAVLVVPPFAEEMNKCRRMIAVLSHRLLANGVAVVMPDLFGTGDSGGDFSDGSWTGWQEDLRNVQAWCDRRGLDLSGLLAVRFGAALAVSAVTSGRLRGFERTVLWQPVFDGARLMTQFLRVRVASTLASGGQRESVADLRGRLAAGETIEVAGYGLAGRLASELDTVKPPECWPTAFGRTRWLEVIRDDVDPGPPPGLAMAEHLRHLGAEIEFKAFRGAPFWSSTEIVVDEELTHASSAFLAGTTAVAEGERVP